MIAIKFVCSLPDLNIFLVSMDQTSYYLLLIGYNFTKLIEQFLKTHSNYYYC